MLSPQVLSSPRGCAWHHTFHGCPADVNVWWHHGVTQNSSTAHGVGSVPVPDAARLPEFTSPFHLPPLNGTPPLCPPTFLLGEARPFSMANSWSVHRIYSVPIGDMPSLSQ